MYPNGLERLELALHKHPMGCVTESYAWDDNARGTRDERLYVKSHLS